MRAVTVPATIGALAALGHVPAADALNALLWLGLAGAASPPLAYGLRVLRGRRG